MNNCQDSNKDVLFSLKMVLSGIDGLTSQLSGKAKGEFHSGWLRLVLQGLLLVHNSSLLLFLLLLPPQPRGFGTICDKSPVDFQAGPHWASVY